MTDSRVVKIGVIGVGNIGSVHAAALYGKKVKGAVLGGLCDTDANRAEKLRAQYPDIPVYASADEMIADGHVEAVIISTPHYDHPTVAIKAFKAGLHVLSEKPMAVYCLAAREMIAEAKKSGKIFSVMFNQRNNKLFAEAHRTLRSGELGELKRMVWIVTNWYRKQAYYDSGAWRATWSGEGGGVLMNQAPHNLDLWRWICGMPEEIYAKCDVAKFHNIEVEDDATIIAKYKNGATATFITTTGEFPGTNRLEISGTKGKIVIEGGRLTKTTLPIDEREYVGYPESEKIVPEVTVMEDEKYNGHILIIENFADAILNGAKLISPGEEAIEELTLSNAAYLSAWTGENVKLPMDDKRFYEMLMERASTSKLREKTQAESMTSDKYNARWNTNW